MTVSSIWSIIYFSFNPPHPFFVSYSTYHHRDLEPSELSEEERKVLSYIKKEHGTKTVIENVIGTFLFTKVILWLYKLSGIVKPPLSEPWVEDTVVAILTIFS